MDLFNNIEPYSLDKYKENEFLLPCLKNLISWHEANCDCYRRFLNTIHYDESKVEKIEDIPFLPVRAFKELELKSILTTDVFKVMKSSGTTKQRPSVIFLDKSNAIVQQKVLLKLMGDFIGRRRMPMLVIDAPKSTDGRGEINTRGATMIGLSYAANEIVFALNEDMSLNEEAIDEFLEKFGENKFIIFAFTFMAWQCLFMPLLKKKRDMKWGMAFY